MFSTTQISYLYLCLNAGVTHICRCSFNLNVFLIRFSSYLYTAKIWLHLITSKAFRSSRSHMFYKMGVFENLAKFTGKHLYLLESRFNKVAHVLSYHLCEIFKNINFLITPRNQTTLLQKQISKNNITEIVARVFICILQNIFRSWAIIFSQSPKVIFWTNCAFPSRISKIALVFLWWMSSIIMIAKKIHYCEEKDRSSRPEVFLEKDVLKICKRFTGEHPCLSVISKKLQSNFIEIALRHGCSLVNLLHIFRISFS